MEGVTMTNQTYILRNQDWSCAIAPDFGANIISLRHDDYPILREPATLSELAGSPVLFGFPLLLPPNRTCNGRFTFEGIEYSLPINEPAHGNHLHGILHSAPFEVLSCSETELQTRLINHGEYFPFPFQITITDHLFPSGLLRTLDFINTGAEAMPLVLGFHTTFTQPDSFSVSIGSRWVVNEHHIPTGEKVALTNEQFAYREGCALTGQRVNGFYEAVNGTARIGNYLFSVEGFDQWILFNSDGKQNYLCVEPQLGPVNALNSGEHRRLESGESYKFTIRITQNS